MPGQDPGVVFLYRRWGNLQGPAHALIGEPLGGAFGQELSVQGLDLMVGSPRVSNGFEGSVHVYQLPAD